MSQEDIKKEILEFEGHEWDENVDSENNNFDYLMGADLDFSVFCKIEFISGY